MKLQCGAHPLSEDKTTLGQCFSVSFPLSFSVFIGVGVFPPLGAHHTRFLPSFDFFALLQHLRIRMPPPPIVRMLGSTVLPLGLCMK